VRKSNSGDVQKLESYLHQTLAVQSLESKVEFRLNPKAGVGVSANGSIRVLKDSCIILSVQPFLGIEAVKCLITKDCVVVVNRLQKEYAVQRLEDSSYKEYLSIQALQDVLLNRMFVPGDVNPDDRKLARFDRLQQKEADGFRWSESSFILDFLFNEDKQYGHLKAYRPEKSETVDVRYSDFKRESFGDFPRRVDVSTAGFKQNTKLQVFYTRPQFNATSDFGFNIPSSYKRVGIAELVKRFQEMI
jgi:hypothetical protein